jgi:hypothetical protein
MKALLLDLDDTLASPMAPAGTTSGSVRRGKREPLPTCRTRPSFQIDNLEFDAAGPQRASLHAAWVNRRGGPLPESCAIAPDRTVRSIVELLDYSITAL